LVFITQINNLIIPLDNTPCLEASRTLHTIAAVRIFRITYIMNRVL